MTNGIDSVTATGTPQAAGTTDTADTANAPDTEDTPDAEDDEGVEDGTIKLDTVHSDDTGNVGEGGEGDGCQKVDFLFVIDSSGSMQDEQTNLLASFPGFLDAIQDTLRFHDFHMMVIDASQVDGNGCEGTLGAGRIRSGNGMDCGLGGGDRFATEDTADLEAAFSCMGARGDDGIGDEQTMDALLAAIGPLNAPGGCNAGFLRDDAILVVTIITDEEDSPDDGLRLPPLDGSCAAADDDPNSNGAPAGWADAVTDAKNGDPDAAVVLSLVGDCDIGGMCEGIRVDLFDPETASGAEPAPRIRQFTEMFGFGSVGPVCAADYTPFFLEAVSVIANACDDFDPPE